MKRVDRNYKRMLHNLAFSFKISYKASAANFFLKSACLTLLAVVPIASAWIWKSILNEIVEKQKNLTFFMLSLVAYLLCMLLKEILTKVNTYLSERYEDDVTFFLEKQMMEKVSKMDLSFFYSAQLGDKVQRVRGNFWVMNNSVWLCFEIVFGMVGFAATLGILLSENVWLGLIVILLMLPQIYVDKKHLFKQNEVEKETVRDERFMYYFENALRDNDVQFESNVNEFGRYFIERYHRHWNNREKKLAKENKDYNIKNIAVSNVSLLGEILVIIHSIIAVLTGKMLIGTAQYYISIVKMVNENASTVFGNFNQFFSHMERLQEINEFLCIEPVIEKSGKLLAGSHPKIEFQKVAFKYPGTSNYILKDCSFVINAGEKIGLIGTNGAGKSTILNLIFRFYDVTQGTILIDGKNIKDYDVYSLRKCFGVLFQDYVTYCLPMREIIALSNFEMVDNDELLNYACELSGAKKFIDKWEKKYDTILGRFYADHGESLSGGQWQVVGLSRAYFRKAKFMILDEPSSALDPITEDRIFNQIYDVFHQSTVLAITHRLSNVRRFDKLLLLENGHIIEEGSPEKLYSQKGRYYELYNMQAKKYEEEKG